MADALLIIDFQNDFCPGGALAVDGGDEIAVPIRRLAGSGRFDFIAATRDWHPPDHASFQAEGGPWPVHCVQGSPGAELHPAMAEIDLDETVNVGRERNDEGYSGFEKSELAQVLREHDVERVFVCGLATDYCVRASTIDACAEGFDTTLVEDAVRPVEVEPGDGQRAIDDMKAAGAKVATSEEILVASGRAG